ncbi:MAG TPA: DUF2252 family protein [Rhizomicrobium sp.]|nr:DUF2252 family protein [Rhizomicrobium sp.]
MNIVEATKSYERWLGSHLPLVARDLGKKHEIMHGSAFGFLRATYYRWLQQAEKHGLAAGGAPAVLAVGDLHIENFGSWRDGEARLVWGINDFDEAHRAPYAVDLVRLAASALVAIDEGSLFVGAQRACREILAGYTESIRAEAGPFVLEEKNAHLRALALNDRHAPVVFWKKLLAKRRPATMPEAEALLRQALPAGTSGILFSRHTAGVGGRGVPRYLATGMLDGSHVAREAKRRAPLSSAWARGAAPAVADYERILARAVRAPDPFLHVQPGWIVRRLAPHSTRIELADLASAAERREVLHAMGAETANIHRGTRGAAARIARHLRRQKDGWLYDAARRMADTVHKDWKAWRKRG